MPFEKGHLVPAEWRNKFRLALTGTSPSAETRRKISLASKARGIPIEVRMKMVATRKSRNHYAHSLETRIRIGLAGRGRRSPPVTRARMGLAHLGHQTTAATSAAISAAKMGRAVNLLRGPNNPNWKGGITSSQEAARGSLEAKTWRKAVFERDDYTCTICGRRGGTLHADHIKRFSDYPELRWVLENGRTLCVDCHRQTPTYGSRMQEAAC